MKKITNALKNYIVDAILLIALGLAMLIWPQWSLKIIFTWIGIGLIVLGAIKGIIYFKAARDYLICCKPNRRKMWCPETVDAQRFPGTCKLCDVLGHSSSSSSRHFSSSCYTSP